MDLRWLLFYILIGSLYIALALVDLKMPALAIKAIPIWMLFFLVARARALPMGLKVPTGIALLLGSAGDILLSLPVAWNFVPGLGAFLIGHIFYIIAFWQLRSFARLKLLAALMLVLLAAGMRLWLDPLPAGLALPVSGYIIVIAGMAVAASFKSGSTLGIPGALLFIISDGMIAIHKFIAPIALSTIWIMVTYYAAQYLLANSILADFSDNEKPAVLTA